MIQGILLDEIKTFVDKTLDKTLLVTGETNTFNNAVLRRFLATDIGEIRIFSRDEKKQHDMRLA